MFNVMGLKELPLFVQDRTILIINSTGVRAWEIESHFSVRLEQPRGMSVRIPNTKSPFGELEFRSFGWCGLEYSDWICISFAEVLSD